METRYDGHGDDKMLSDGGWAYLICHDAYLRTELRLGAISRSRNFGCTTDKTGHDESRQHLVDASLRSCRTRAAIEIKDLVSAEGIEPSTY
jgi:hypothetical protein